MLTWLTVADIARRLDRPPSTIRSWRDRYSEFVPGRLDARGQQIYPLERLAEIQALQADSLTPREVRRTLAERHQGGDSVDESPPDAVRLDQVLRKLEDLNDKVDWLIARERAREQGPPDTG